MRRQKTLSRSVTKSLVDIERTASLPNVRLGRRAERHGVGNLLVEEVELELGAHRIVKEQLVARVFDVLFLEIDAELLQMLAELHRARSLEGDVVHAAAMLVLYDRALRKARADVDDRVVAVVEPDAAELEIGPVTGLQAKHLAVKPRDRGNILRRAPDVEMQKTLESHGYPPGDCLDRRTRSYHKRLHHRARREHDKINRQNSKDVQESQNREEY